MKAEVQSPSTHCLQGQIDQGILGGMGKEQASLLHPRYALCSAEPGMVTLPDGWVAQRWHASFQWVLRGLGSDSLAILSALSLPIVRP